MKVTVDEKLCVGCGLCCDICPDVFEMQGDIAVVKVSEVPENAVESVKQSASDCPAEAIKVE